MSRKLWLEDSMTDEHGNEVGINGREECKDHDKEDCPECSDVSIEKKPFVEGKSKLDKVFGEIFKDLINKGN